LIVRVLQGHVHPGQVAVFREQAQQALLDARRHDGLVFAKVARQAHADGGEEVVFISVWRDLEALYRWVGGTDLLDTPVLTTGSFEVFEHFDVQHYETYETPEADQVEAAETSSGVVRPVIEAAAGIVKAAR
jgi:heme-degrading monooxygenase HmoA